MRAAIPEASVHASVSRRAATTAGGHERGRADVENESLGTESISHVIFLSTQSYIFCAHGTIRIADSRGWGHVPTRRRAPCDCVWLTETRGEEDASILAIVGWRIGRKPAPDSSQSPIYIAAVTPDVDEGRAVVIPSGEEPPPPAPRRRCPPPHHHPPPACGTPSLPPSPLKVSIHTHYVVIHDRHYTITGTGTNRPQTSTPTMVPKETTFGRSLTDQGRRRR